MDWSPKELIISNKLTSYPIIVCISLLLCLVWGAPALSAETIRIGYFSAPPFAFKDKQTDALKGASVDFLEKFIAPQMGVEIIWAEKAMSVPRLMSMLENHELDAAAYLGFRQDRLSILTYPIHPYYETQPVLAFLKDHPIERIQTIDDIAGLKIGYSSKSFLSPLMRDNRINFEFVTTGNTILLNLRKLLDKRIDAQYQPESPILLYYAKHLHAEDKIKILRLPEKKIKVYTAFSRKSDNTLAQRFDRAFLKIGGKEIFLKILSEYIEEGKP